MNNKVSIEIKMLTPLWTGGVNGKCDRLHETGIIGSMRWWYEAIVRGLDGGYACDLNSEPCIYDADIGLASICLACQLFGCSGYSRRFRLVAEGNSNVSQLAEVKLNKSGAKNHKGWRIPVNLLDPVTLSFMPMHKDSLENFNINALYYAICLIERYGALGAKTSHGQGVVEVMNWGNLIPKMDFYSWLTEFKQRPKKKKNNVVSTPNLKNFIGFTFAIDISDLNASDLWGVVPLEAHEINGQIWKIKKDDKWIPSAPAFRAMLRSWLRISNNIPGFDGNLTHKRHQLMGTIQRWDDPKQTDRGVKDRPKGSDIFVTHFYKFNNRWSMRVFGFINCDGDEADVEVRKLFTDRDKLGDELRQIVGDLSVHINPYPLDIESLLIMTQGEQ